MSDRAAMDRLTHRYFSGVGASRSRHIAVMARKNHDRRERLTGPTP
jgi:hypothetical protein